MRVVHLNTSVRWGGGELQVLELMRGLRRRGHESILLARPEGELLDRARDGDELEVHPFGFRTRYSPLSVARLRRLLRTLAADVLHLHDGHAVALGVPATRGLGELGLVVHRRISSPMRRNPWSRAHYRSPRVDALIAVSEAARGSLLAIDVAADRTHVVPSGIDARRVFPRNGQRVPQGGGDSRAAARRELGLEGTTWIGTVGALEPKKDVGTFVRMAGLLADRDPAARFLVVGEGSQRAELETLARTLGLDGRLRFVGQVANACRHIAALDAFVFPSRREGSPGVVKEAMALGVPIVAAEAPGTVEVLREELGLRVAPGDARAFAAAVSELLADRPSARRRARAARRYVLERFSMERTVERTLAVYDGVLRERRAASGDALVPQARRTSATLPTPRPLGAVPSAAPAARAELAADGVAADS